MAVRAMYIYQVNVLPAAGAGSVGAVTSAGAGTAFADVTQKKRSGGVQSKNKHSHFVFTVRKVPRPKQHVPGTWASITNFFDSGQTTRMQLHA